MFGANASPYSQPGEWQVSLSSRNLVSNDHYNGTVEQHERQELQNYVNNTQNLFDINVTRVFTRRVSLSAGVPFVSSTWAARDPAFPHPQPRREIPQHGRGLGDISVTGRAWIFNPMTHPDWNVSAGLGLKMPTGASDYQDTFLNRVTRVEEKQYVDQSVQPGDGGWGIVFETNAFWRVKQAFLFGSATYLANPRDTNDTPSIIQVLGLGNMPQYQGLLVNSVPDQYLVRLGGTVPVWKGFAASVAWRMEGLKRYDLFGGSHGWRRPGTAMFVEPGVSYSTGRHTFTFNVPIGYYYNRHRNPYTGNPGDATFPRHIFLSSYSLRLGRRAVTPPATDFPPDPGTPRESEGTAPKTGADARASRTSMPQADAGGGPMFCPPPVVF
ncbi:MAG TPA: hypothetical protein VIL35_06845 [Vicinamibacterales bacterium]